MSLEQPGTSKKVRARSQRTRPKLVTERTEGPETATLAPDTEKLAVDIAETSSAAEPVAAPRPRRLPGFFSTVGKNDQRIKQKRWMSRRPAWRVRPVGKSHNLKKLPAQKKPRRKQRVRQPAPAEHRRGQPAHSKHAIFSVWLFT